MQSVVTAITTAQAAIPAMEPFIVSEGAEGLAYHALPTPKGSVLTAVNDTVNDLNSKISSVNTAF